MYLFPTVKNTSSSSTAAIIGGSVAAFLLIIAITSAVVPIIITLTVKNHCGNVSKKEKEWVCYDIVLEFIHKPKLANIMKGQELEWCFPTNMHYKVGYIIYLVRNTRFTEFLPCFETHVNVLSGSRGVNCNFEGYTTMVLSPSYSIAVKELPSDYHSSTLYIILQECGRAVNVCS